MRLVKVSSGWYETHDGRFAVLRSASGWSVATVPRSGVWISQRYRTKREAAAAVAERITEERTSS